MRRINIKRYTELDSLRGIAALMVLISHFFYVFTFIGEQLNTKIGNVLPFLQNAHSSVILFFVLSGFVLSLPFYKNSKFVYSDYLIKRICRIYVPYIVVILISILAHITLHNKIGTIPGLVEWAIWNNKITFENIKDHILFLGVYNFNAYVMVIWSLVHEMRISLVFPLLMYLIIKFNWKINILIAISLTIISFELRSITNPNQYNSPTDINYFVTLHYTSMFIIGAILAKHRDLLTNKLSSFKMKYLLIPLGVICFSFPKFPYIPVVLVFGNINFNLYLLIIDWIIALGASSLILITLSSGLISKILTIKPINFLGKVSYSLYLIHPIILIGFAHALYGKVTIPLILLLSFPTTLLMAWISYKYIEKPSIRIGKILTQKRNLKKLSKQEAPA